jgi:hypothetical protein
VKVEHKPKIVRVDTIQIGHTFIVGQDVFIRIAREKDGRFGVNLATGVMTEFAYSARGCVVHYKAVRDDQDD